MTEAVASKRMASPKKKQKELSKNYEFYLLLIPGILTVVIFNIIPLVGLLLAFKDYQMFAASNPFVAILKSEWVGLKHFKHLFGRSDFLGALGNTLIISLMKIAINFPIPIVFALLLNELRSQRFSKSVQLVAYLPHFLSWAVVSGIFVTLLSSTGMVNGMLVKLGMDPVNFLMSNSTFRWILVFTDGWKEFGWSSIIYLSAITGLDEECYEAARVDGATRFQQMRHITLPGIAPTIVMMFILRTGRLMGAGFEQILTMYNPTVYQSVDIIETFVYRIGLGQMDYSMGTAVGLFNSVVGLVLVLGSNKIAKKITGNGLW